MHVKMSEIFIIYLPINAIIIALSKCGEKEINTAAFSIMLQLCDQTVTQSLSFHLFILCYKVLILQKEPPYFVNIRPTSNAPAYF